MKIRLAILVCLLIPSLPVTAQTANELAEIRQQLDQLIKRVDKLEAENVALRSENVELRRNVQEEAATPPPRVSESADRPNRVSLKGDLRYRHERTDDAAQASERERDLLRARVLLEAKATENIVVGVGLSTTEDGNPRGGNQTLDGEFSRKSLDLDLGYFDWTITKGLHAIGGKMKTPFFRPGQSLFFDNDVNPEGLALTYERASWFGSAFHYWIDENVPVSGSTPSNADAMMLGGQFGVKLPIGASSTLKLAASYYDLAAAQGRRPFYNGSSNGNSVIGSGDDAVLAHDFRVAQIAAELHTHIATLPLQLWMDVARNQAAELDTAYALGTLIGRAADKGSWEAGIAYQLIEKDALFAQHIDSDFAGGVSDSSGWVLRAGYAPLENWTINASYFMTRKNVDVGLALDFDRLLLDFNVKY